MNNSAAATLIKDEETGALYRRWTAPSPKAALLLVHGICSHSGRWQPLADYFLKNGISSYAIEMEGFNQAEGSRRRPESLDLYFTDIRRLRGIIAEEYPAARIFILGESAGAVISFLMTAMEPSFFEALVCVSPAFTNRLHFTFYDYGRIFLSFLYNPERPCAMPITSEMCTRDAGYQKIIDSELEGHRQITSRLLVDMALAQIRSRILKNKIAIPVLFLVAGRDTIVDSRASVGIFNDLKIADKKMIQYPEMRHSLTIELGRKSVFQDILKWLREMMSIIPSHL